MSAAFKDRRFETPRHPFGCTNSTRTPSGSVTNTKRPKARSIGSDQSYERNAAPLAFFDQMIQIAHAELKLRRTRDPGCGSEPSVG